MSDSSRILSCKRRTFLHTGKSTLIQQTVPPLNYIKVTHVPVGEERKPYLELTRDLAEIFIRAYLTLSAFIYPILRPFSNA
jgi:tryptophanyl-tRNA synthetase